MAHRDVVELKKVVAQKVFWEESFMGCVLF